MDAAKDEAAGCSRPGTATCRHSAGAGDSSKRGGNDGVGVVAQSWFRPVSAPQRAWSEAIHGRVELSTASTDEAVRSDARRCVLEAGEPEEEAGCFRGAAGEGGSADGRGDGGGEDGAVSSAPAMPSGIGAAGRGRPTGEIRNAEDKSAADT